MYDTREKYFAELNRLNFRIGDYVILHRLPTLEDGNRYDAPFNHMTYYDIWGREGYGFSKYLNMITTIHNIQGDGFIVLDCLKNRIMPCFCLEHSKRPLYLDSRSKFLQFDQKIMAMRG